jgi:preprotein translocase subunit SecA
LAGRGVDLKLNEEVEESGGLHVCVTFLPSNLRVQKQAFGRTARKGKRGTAQLVLNYAFEVEKFGLNFKIANKITKLQKSYENNSFAKNKIEEYCKIHDIPNTIDDFERFRNDEENKILESAENEINKIDIKDELFKKFCQLVNEEIKNLKDDESTLNSIEEIWGIWLSDVNVGKSKSEVLNDFTEFKNNIIKNFAEDKVILNANYLNQKCLKALTDGVIPTGKFIYK